MTPIVFHHGLLGFGEIRVGGLRYGYFHRIDRAFAEMGHPVIISRVHPTGSIARRASELKETVLRQLEILKQPRAVIFAHSMGGLDARYMITRLGMADRVTALVTICTPHRGSPYADWCLEHIGRRLGGLQLARFMGLDVQAVNDLTVRSCALFNEDVPDEPSVSYFSVTASRPWKRVAPIFVHSCRLIDAEEGDNDGLVSVLSGTWGRHLGTWPADHLHVLNKRLLPELGPDATGDVTPRYLAIRDHLCDLGLCNGAE